MSGWIDPLGTRFLMRYIDKKQIKLKELIEIRERIHPNSKRTSKYRGRHAELSRIKSLLLAVSRPGMELKPHKALINLDLTRPDKIRLIDSKAK